MKLRALLAAAALLLSAWIMPAEARADTLIYDGISLFSGQQSFTQSFTVTTAGTLTFSLSTISWLDTVSDLSGFLSTTSGEIGSTIGAGTESVSVAAGTYYAHWFGDAQGTYNLGVVGLKINFQPVTPVSLPASLVLMLSGLGLLFGWQSRRVSGLTPGPVPC